MRRLLSLLLALPLGACLPDYRTVDEACDDKLPGSSNIDNDAALEVFGRINCYRRVAKLSRARMDKLVQQAVEKHLFYQQQNFVPENWGSKLEEVSGLPGYTGSSAYERLEATGYPDADSATLGLWNYYYWDTTEAVDRIDFWFHDPQAREGLLQLAWVAGGYAEGPLQNIEAGSGYSPNMAYMNIFYQIPIRDHAGTPAIYPRDGQEEIPTGFEAVDPDNPMTGKGLIGYPITVAVGSDAHGMGNNPHDIQVKSATLTGPEGKVDLEIYTPATDTWMRYQAAFYPLTPLQPNSEYTFEFEMDWGNQSGRSFTSTFFTGPESVPHAPSALTGREVPRKPVITHHILQIPGH